MHAPGSHGAPRVQGSFCHHFALHTYHGNCNTKSWRGWSKYPQILKSLRVYWRLENTDALTHPNHTCDCKPTHRLCITLPGHWTARVGPCVRYDAAGVFSLGAHSPGIRHLWAYRISGRHFPWSSVGSGPWCVTILSGMLRRCDLTSVRFDIHLGHSDAWTLALCMCGDDVSWSIFTCVQNFMKCSFYLRQIIFYRISVVM